VNSLGLNIAPRSARTFDLIAVGECMVELHADQPLGTANTLEKSYGGDVLNSLVTAARLGSRTAFITRVGDDPFGAGLLERWAREGVNTAQARLITGENGLYFISLLPGGEREFTYRRAGSAASELSSSDLNEEFIASSRAVLLSGITQAISESARAATLEAARMARANGVLVAFDPNFRPRLWAVRGGKEAARNAFLELAPLVDVFLPSHPDDTTLFTDDPTHELEEVARDLAARHALTVFKNGAQGALVANALTHQHVPAAAVRVLDTTGAGDAWNGAFLHALLNGSPPLEAAGLAHRVAAATLAHRGAIPPRSSLTFTNTGATV
jgi:2-dehydro-3-deoxygluconokinase